MSSNYSSQKRKNMRQNQQKKTGIVIAVAVVMTIFVLIGIVKGASGGEEQGMQGDVQISATSTPQEEKNMGTPTPEPTNTTSNQANNVSNEIENKPSTNTVEVPNTSTTNVGKKGVINVDTAKVRETPNGNVIGLVDLNDSVEILSEEGDWYKANIDEYKNCYIAKRLVTIK